VLAVTGKSQKSVSPKQRSSSYIPGLDGIRAIAFLLVFFAHASTYRVAVYIPATLGVTIFFFLSGYLITTLLRKEFERTGTISLRDFYIRRALRILVPLYIVYGIAELADRFILHEHVGTLSGLFSTVFYYFNYAYALGAYGVSFNAFVPSGMSIIWSLCIEEHFYLLFPIVFLALNRSRLSRRAQMFWLVGFCVLELAWRSVRVLDHFRAVIDWNYYATDARLDSILWGSILAMFANPVMGDRTILPSRWQAGIFGAATLGLVVSLAIPGSLYHDAFRYTVQALLLFVIFSFVLSHSSHWSIRWLEWPFVRYLGWTSYVLYLCHYMVLHIIGDRMHWLPRLLLGFTLSLAFATVMRYGVELPLQRLRGHFRHVPESDPTATDGHGLIA
jgi:peptidoglycan/LPS O-acetylase OafA/YrhL